MTTAKASDQIDTIRHRLQAERASGESTLADLTTQLETLRSAAIASNGDDEHDPEGSTVAFEAAQLETLRGRAEERLTEIDQAIERLASGSYRTCARCGRTIGAPRLAALPAAELCVQCAGMRK